MTPHHFWIFGLLETLVGECDNAVCLFCFLGFKEVHLSFHQHGGEQLMTEFSFVGELFLPGVISVANLNFGLCGKGKFRQIFPTISPPEKLH